MNKDKLSPGYVRAVASIEPLQNPGASIALMKSRDMAKAAAEGLEKIAERAEQINADRTRTAEGRAVRVAKAATGIANGIKQATVQAKERIAAEYLEAEQRISEAIRVKDNDQTLAAEIRQFARSLNAEERNRLTGQAISSNDTHTLKALLQGPAYLAGLSPESLARIRSHLAQLVAPDDTAHLDNLTQADQAIREAEAVLTAAAGQFLTPEVQKLMEAAAAVDA